MFKMNFLQLQLYKFCAAGVDVQLGCVGVLIYFDFDLRGEEGHITLFFLHIYSSLVYVRLHTKN